MTAQESSCWSTFNTWNTIDSGIALKVVRREVYAYRAVAPQMCLECGQHQLRRYLSTDIFHMVGGTHITVRSIATAATVDASLQQDRSPPVPSSDFVITRYGHYIIAQCVINITKSFRPSSALKTH